MSQIDIDEILKHVKPIDITKKPEPMATMFFQKYLTHFCFVTKRVEPYWDNDRACENYDYRIVFAIDEEHAILHAQSKDPLEEKSPYQAERLKRGDQFAVKQTHNKSYELAKDPPELLMFANMSDADSWAWCERCGDPHVEGLCFSHVCQDCLLCRVCASKEKSSDDLAIIDIDPCECWEDI
jgi:hypothetical protein